MVHDELDAIGLVQRRNSARRQGSRAVPWASGLCRLRRCARSGALIGDLAARLHPRVSSARSARAVVPGVEFVEVVLVPHAEDEAGAVAFGVGVEVLDGPVVERVGVPGVEVGGVLEGVKRSGEQDDGDAVKTMRIPFARLAARPLASPWARTLASSSSAMVMASRAAGRALGGRERLAASLARSARSVASDGPLMISDCAGQHEPT